ncbi:MAG: SDR family NAD(P)-dependent oxidoreductase [Sulfolobales archaeon]
MRRIAVVTGASSGIGRELVYQLAERGYNMIMISRRRDVLESIAEDLKRKNVEANPIEFDLSRVDEIKTLAEKILSISSGIDLLVNNAGAGIYGPLQELEDFDIMRIINLNLIAPILLTKNLLKALIDRRGCIVNISSLAAYTPIPWLEVYASTKAALALFTDTLRIELKPYGVRVLGVLPGYVATEFHRNTITTPTSSRIRGGVRGPVLDPKYVAKVLVDKISDEKFNGNIIPSKIYRISFSLLRLADPLMRVYISREYMRRLKEMKR